MTTRPSPVPAPHAKAARTRRRTPRPSPVLTTVLTAVAAVVSLTTGCGASSDATPTRSTTVAGLHAQAVDQDWPVQEQILADGHVSPDELATAFADFRSCVEGYGLTVSEPSVNRVDGWRLLADIDYNGVTDQDTIDDANDCSRTRMSLVEIGYEISNPPHMDPALMTWVRDCLTKRGLATTGTERSVADLAAGDDTRFEKVQTCVQAGAHTLYPGEPLAITY